MAQVRVVTFNVKNLVRVACLSGLIGIRAESDRMAVWLSTHGRRGGQVLPDVLERQGARDRQHRRRALEQPGERGLR